MTRCPSALPTFALAQIAELISNAALAAPVTTADNIRRLHQDPIGAEILRLIVRDNLGTEPTEHTANIIIDALWSDL